VQTKFADWICRRIEKYGFEEGKDFMTISQKRETEIIEDFTQMRKDYYVTVEMAKELSMVENNEKGQLARRYFIECEKQLRKVFEIPQTYSQALMLAGKLAEENEKQAKQIEQSKPKVEFYDRIIQSETAINMQEVAGVINVKGYGRNNLFAFLREKGILNFKNIPYRKYIEAGYFEVKETTRSIRGIDEVLLVTLVSQKGIEFIKDRLEEHLAV
jgi:anti-repressor protein